MEEGGWRGGASNNPTNNSSTNLPSIATITSNINNIGIPPQQSRSTTDPHQFVTIGQLQSNLSTAWHGTNPASFFLVPAHPLAGLPAFISSTQPTTGVVLHPSQLHHHHPAPIFPSPAFPYSGIIDTPKRNNNPANKPMMMQQSMQQQQFFDGLLSIPSTNTPMQPSIGNPVKISIEAQTIFIPETADLLAVESRLLQQQLQQHLGPSGSSVTSEAGPAYSPPDNSLPTTSSAVASPASSPFTSSPPLSSPAVGTPTSSIRSPESCVPTSPYPFGGVSGQQQQQQHHHHKQHVQQQQQQRQRQQPLDPQLLRFSLVKAAGTEKERQLLEVLLRIQVPNTPEFESVRSVPPEKLQETVRWSLRTSDQRPHPMPETIIQRKFLAQPAQSIKNSNGSGAGGGGGAATKRKRVARRTVSQLEPMPPGVNEQGMWQVDLCFAFTFPTKTLAPVYIRFEIDALGVTAQSHPIVAFIHVREYPVALESILWHKLARNRSAVAVEHALFAIDRFFLCWKSVRPIRDDVDLRYLLHQARIHGSYLSENEFGILWRRAYAMHELLLEDDNFKTLWRNRPKLVEGYALRDDTERLLIGHPTGTFIIRLGSQEAKVSISYRSNELGVQHALIEHTKTKEDESYRDANSDECYPSLFKLILRSPTLDQILVTLADGNTALVPKQTLEPLLRNSERKRRARSDYQSLDTCGEGACIPCEEKDRRIEELESELENLKVLLELERNLFQQGSMTHAVDPVAELSTLSLLNIAHQNADLRVQQSDHARDEPSAPAYQPEDDVDAYLISGM